LRILRQVPVAAACSCASQPLSAPALFCLLPGHAAPAGRSASTCKDSLTGV
jgi:hypothetical protein